MLLGLMPKKLIPLLFTAKILRTSNNNIPKIASPQKTLLSHLRLRHLVVRLAPSELWLRVSPGGAGEGDRRALLDDDLAVLGLGLNARGNCNK